MNIPAGVISKRELAAYRADVKGSIFRQVREIFSRLKEVGFTQKQFAARIDMDEGQLSRRLRGESDLQLETLSDLARGLNCRIDVRLVQFDRPTSQEVRPVSPKVDMPDLGGTPKPASRSNADNDNQPLFDVVAS